MSDALPADAPGRDRRLARVFNTPLGELLRGRVTGREPIVARARAARATRAAAEAERAAKAAALAALPADARDLVGRVVRRSRLWRRERADVTDELVAHFADGLAAGDSAADLLAAFGDERRAARLIRRAKVRNRPLLWHLLRFCRRAAGVLLLVYAVLAIRFYLGRPTLSVDYLARVNAAAERTPEDQRAWPAYARVLVELDVPDAHLRPPIDPATNPPANAGSATTQPATTQPAAGSPTTTGAATTSPATTGPVRSDVAAEDRQRDQRFQERLTAKPGWRRWPELDAWLDAHAATVERLRRAAAKPALGFVLGPNGSQRQPPLNIGERAAAGQTPLIELLLPYLSQTRTLALVLAADLRAARVRGDRDRVARDAEAMLSMAEQVRGPFLVDQLVAIGLDALAFDEVGRALAAAPDVLSDAALVRLAHRVGDVGEQAPLLDFRGERMSFYDLIQRFFTDDGTGDGRLTPTYLTGRVAAARSLAAWEPQQPTLGSPLLWVGPLGVVASRREQVAEYDRLMDAYQAQCGRPARAGDLSAVQARLREIRSSPLLTVRYLPVSVAVPAFDRAFEQAERLLGQRDGLTVAVALELYRRRHGGAYPPSLDALVPGLLPRVPADRITGGPVRYRLVDGKPVVYSVGVDRRDDGGRPATDRSSTDPRSAPRLWPYAAAKWPNLSYKDSRSGPPNPVESLGDGDWVLFPVWPDEPEPPVAGQN